MPGRVLREAVDVTVPGPAVATYESGTSRKETAARDTAADPEIVERLQSLGYIQSGHASPAPNPAGGAVRSPQGERNLAGLQFEAGRFKEAADAYAQLVRENPKDAALHTSLAGALGALGRSDEAMRHLDTALSLAPLNVEAHHNRAVILERQGKREAAIEQYRIAVRYSPQYEPSRQALDPAHGLGGRARPPRRRRDARRRRWRRARAVPRAGETTRRP